MDVKIGFFDALTVAIAVFCLTDTGPTPHAVGHVVTWRSSGGRYPIRSGELNGVELRRVDATAHRRKHV